MSNTDWDQPLISVDVVTLKLDKADNKIKFLVGSRKFEPYKGDFALPGVLLSPTERVTEAAMRALKSKVNLSEEHVRVLRDIGIADNPDRDPRGATLSIVMLAIVDNTFVPENDETRFVAIEELDTFKLPFDHANLVRKALLQLEALLMNDKKVSRGLLGDEFRTTELYSVYAGLNSVVVSENSVLPDLSNLSRTLKNTDGIVSKTSSVKSSTGRGRPSTVWGWE